MRNAKVLAAVYVGMLVISAVAVNLTRPDGPIGLPDVELTAAALQPFDACDDALAYFTEAAAEQAELWRGREGAEQFATDQATDDGGARAAAPVPEAAMPQTDAAGGGDPAFSGTNVQEAGVDEPDRVKTDGRRIATLTGGRLHVLDVTAQPPVLAGSLALPGDGAHELLLDGDRALVFSQHWSDTPLDGEGRTMPGGAPQSVLTLVDLAETATPRVTSTLTLEGEYVTARMVDGVARVVLRSQPAGPVHEPLPLPEPAPLPGPADSSSGAVPETAQHRETTIDDWVPHYRLEGAATTTSDQLVPCAQIHRPAEFAGLGMVSVVSVDLAGDLTPGAGASVVADAQSVYASPDTLYVAFTDWQSPESTQIHAFDITDPAAAVYTASGSVSGRLLNQWALSEHAGHLRVATTEGDTWGGMIDDVAVQPAPDVPGTRPAPPPSTPSQSAVTVLAAQGDALVAVGRVEGLGPDERIYSVRFMGDVGYVVTFRETDPLYTLDLSDPTAPRVLGELKILGYSAYLHPLGDGLLLGVGQDATQEGRTLGTQLSLFDVSDLSTPSRLHQVTLPGGNSAVEYDHRAFLHWPATGTIVVPLEIYPHDQPVVSDSDIFTGAVVFTADRARGFAEVGRLSHTGHARDAWMGAIHRSLVVDDTLYTVSDAGVQAADLATLDERAFIPLAR